MLIKKIEAREACDWLQAAGFPQYVQLFKDCRFPIDIKTAKNDHRFLDEDSLDSLCRRLITLNKCTEMRLELWRSKHKGDDWDEEDSCAISPNWTYDQQTRQWRRLDSNDEVLHLSACPAGHQDVSQPDDISSVDSEDHDEGHRVPTIITGSTADEQEANRSSSRCSSTNKAPSMDTSLSGPPSPEGGSSSVSLEAEQPPRRKCTTLLRKMEKLRLRGGLAHRNRRRMSRPILVREAGRTDRLLCPSNLQARSNSRSSSSPSSPRTISSSSSQSEDSSTVSTPSPVARVRSNFKRSNSGVGTIHKDQSHTDTEVSRNRVSSSSQDSLVFQIPHGHKPGTFPTSLAHKHILSPIMDSSSINWRTGSFHGYRGRQDSKRGPSSLATRDQSPASSSSGRPAAADHRLSVYDNMLEDAQMSEIEVGSDAERTGEELEVSRLMAGEDVFSALDSVLERISNLQQLVSTWSENMSEDDGQRSSSSSQDSPPHGSSLSHIHLEVQHPEEEESQEEDPENLKISPAPPQRSRASQRLQWSSEQNLPSSLGLESQSASQILLLQKLSLLKLTALMDKFSPSSKQGWSWNVPKSPRKTKEIGVKGRVFGVPLLVCVQQTGEPLPPCILRALVYLRTKCLDQVGLFRKSGVKSRIQYLREMVESDPDGVSFEGQSAFDVADMVKQYFRDLPEPIFSSKLCETFLHIYTYFPKDQQMVASQAAILLLPDENREALRLMLFFLRDVVSCVEENQMTPTNIAVCLAPSLFHLNTLKRDTNAARSGHMKYSLCRPDQRDLSENLAATQGLASMISKARRLFQLPEFWPDRSLAAPGSTEDSHRDDLRGPAAQPSQDEGREEQIRLQLSTQQLLKEVREQGPVWENHLGPEHVDLSYRKMRDSCPLWMWRGSVEVNAPQHALLQRLLREHHLWEERLHQAAVIQTLSKDMEVYWYLLRGRGHSLGSQPLQEHLLLRTWQSDPSSGPLFLSSVSTEHPDVQVQGIRSHIHSSLYLLEPTGAMKTRLTHVCRTDTRGRSQEWHSRVSGHLLAASLLSIRDSFSSDYRETNI
uniref:Rho GTPase activating protein 7 n=4 Tax=Nothobranchius TaxID=28779 RepID=A0A1A8D0N2_NOTKA